MSLSEIFSRFKTGEKPIPGPLSEAVTLIQRTAKAASKQSIASPLLEASKVVIHSLKAHREALEAGAAVLNLIEQAKPEWTPEQQQEHALLVKAGISLFKEYAVKARIHQTIPRVDS